MPKAKELKYEELENNLARKPSMRNVVKKKKSEKIVMKKQEPKAVQEEMPIDNFVDHAISLVADEGVESSYLPRLPSRMRQNFIKVIGSIINPMLDKSDNTGKPN